MKQIPTKLHVTDEIIEIKHLLDENITSLENKVLSL